LYIKMRSMLLLVLACCAVASAQVVRIDRRKLHNIAETLGVTNFLEEAPDASDAASAQKEAESFAASPLDLETGNFEIKCQTSCGFVKTGTLTKDMGDSGSGAAALDAAEELAAAQDELRATQKELMTSPTDTDLQAKEIQLQAQVQDKVQALQAAAGLPQTVSGLETTAVSLAAAKQRLVEATEKYAETPNSALEAAVDLEKAEVKKLEAMIKAQKEPDKDLESKIAKMQRRLKQLKAALAATPEDPALQDEVATVEKALEDKAKEAGSFSPKTSCSRVCMDKEHHSDDEPLESGSPSPNCMRMCVKVMRHLVYHMSSESA